MMNELISHISEEDGKVIARELKLHEVKFRARLSSLESIIHEWEYLVSLLTPYSYSIYPYVRFLHCRDLLDVIFEKITFEGQNTLLKIIEPIDKQFELLTNPIKLPLRESGYLEDKWWWYRIPIEWQISQEFQMFPEPLFRQEDQQTLERLMSGLSKVMYVTSPTQRIEYLMSLWINAVLSVSIGYKLDVDSYRLDLHTRYILAQTYQQLSSDGKNVVDRILKAADDLFIKSTFSMGELSSFSFINDSGAEWLNRIPLKTYKRFSDHIEKLGLDMGLKQIEVLA